jgi:hypothetical protein
MAYSIEPASPGTKAFWNTLSSHFADQYENISIEVKHSQIGDAATVRIQADGKEVVKGYALLSRKIVNLRLDDDLMSQVAENPEVHTDTQIILIENPAQQGYHIRFEDRLDIFAFRHLLDNVPPCIIKQDHTTTNNDTIQYLCIP